MLDPDQRRLLGDFVRAHRERLSPETPAAGRRRTPGMRREELAAKAGMSATWCAWIEQGREVQASPEALGRLARALVLSRAERAYLFELSGRRDPEPGGFDPMPDAPASLRAIVAALADSGLRTGPAVERVLLEQGRGTIVRRLARRRASAQSAALRLSRSGARRLIPDWEDRARRLLAEFRADYAQTFRDARVRGLADGLLAGSSLFADAWNEQGVQQNARAACANSSIRPRARSRSNSTRSIPPSGGTTSSWCW